MNIGGFFSKIDRWSNTKCWRSVGRNVGGDKDRQTACVWVSEFYKVEEMSKSDWHGNGFN